MADHKDTKTYSPSDAALFQLASSIRGMGDRVEEVAKAQQEISVDLVEHSKRSSEMQAMLLGEISKVKTDLILGTGDQRRAIEILRIEREAMDNELRSRIEYYEKQQPAMLRRLEKISERLESGSAKIDKGVMAWTVLKWAGAIIGGLVLSAVAAKLFGSTTLGATTFGSNKPIGVMTGGMGFVWSAWIGASGVVAFVMDVLKLKCLGG